jgi:hypothetical protein
MSLVAAVLLGTSGFDVQAPASVSPSVLEAINAGQSVEAMLEFEVTDVNAQAAAMAADAGRATLGDEELAFKRAQFAAVKQAALGMTGVTVLQDYPNLATTFVRIADAVALSQLQADPTVRAIQENKVYSLSLTETLPFINQDDVVAQGVTGAGRTVAVIDTGVDYTRAAFGSCTAPNSPAGTCRVLETLEAATDDGSLDDSGHGTNVSGIVAGTAPGANLVVADVFVGTGAAFSDISEAINWAIARRSTYNIVAVNLSIQDGSANVAPCVGYPLASDLDMARSAGIQPVVAAGNLAYLNGSFRDGISGPACVPAAVSVGAVYDANYGGGLTWQGGSPYACTDATTAADRVTCFSQTAPFLSLLAPGTFVVAAGTPNYSGTSMAAPHVAGAWALYSAALPNATQAEILAALQQGGQPVTDGRVVNRVTSRIDLFGGLDLDHDAVIVTKDNCAKTANGVAQGSRNQCDTDMDGYGNVCDGDFNQSGQTTSSDYGMYFVPDFQMGVDSGRGTDMNCDGVVTSSDYGMYFVPNFTQGYPGPSGMGCAGTWPCVDVTGAGDTDVDSVANKDDDCVTVKNGPGQGTNNQCDTDADGYGNACDGDFNQTGQTTSSDYGMFFVPDFQAGVDSGRGTDMNCSGAVTSSDYGMFFVPNFGQGYPGPTGRTCAGSPGCL